MKAPKFFSKIVNGKRYDVATATLIADDVYFDGHNMERGGRNQFLYRTPKGNYFLVTLTQWQGERDTLIPLTKTEALETWEDLPEKEVDYEVAFPGEKVEDA